MYIKANIKKSIIYLHQNFSRVCILGLIFISLSNASAVHGAAWDYLFSINLMKGNKFQDKFNKGLSLMNNLGNLNYTAEDGTTKQYTTRVMQRTLFRNFNGVGGSFLVGVNQTHYFGIKFNLLIYSSTHIIFHLYDENDNQAGSEQIDLHLTAMPVQAQYKYRITMEAISFFLGGGIGYAPITLQSEIKNPDTSESTSSNSAIYVSIDFTIAYEMNKNFSLFGGLGLIQAFPQEKIKLDGDSGSQYFNYKKDDSIKISSKESGDSAELDIDCIYFQLGVSYYFK